MVAGDVLEVLQEVRVVGFIEGKYLVFRSAPEGICCCPELLVGFVEGKGRTLCPAEVYLNETNAALEGSSTDLLDTRSMDLLETDVPFKYMVSDLLDRSLELHYAIFWSLVNRIVEEDTILDLDLSAWERSAVDGHELILLSEVYEVSDLLCRYDEILLFGSTFEGSFADGRHGSAELEALERRALEGSCTDLGELGSLKGSEGLVAFEDLICDLGDLR